jgi:soluble lytic murein transglycosylase
MRTSLSCSGVLILCLLLAAGLWLQYHTTCYDHMIAQAAARNGVDFYLVKAVLFEESWFRPSIRGPAGEIGLMQVSMAAATDFAVRKGLPPFYPERLLEPELNIEIGSWYLRQSLDRYKDSPAPILFALLRYNAGEARADRWLQITLSEPVPPGLSKERYYLSRVDFPKTREYARRILQRSRSHNFWY